MLNQNRFFFKNPKYIDLIIDSTKQGLFEIDVTTGEGRVNEDYHQILGYKKEEFHSSLQQFTEDIHPEDLQYFLQQYDDFIKNSDKGHMELRRKDAFGKWIWVDLKIKVSKRDSHNKPTKVIGVMSNTDEEKKDNLKNKIYHLVFMKLAKGLKLEQILEQIILEIEAYLPHSYCSVLLSNLHDGYLYLGSAPSLPEFYKKATKKIKIADGVGSCGEASFKKKRVEIENIQTHPNWEVSKEVVKKAGLFSCWSQPIFDQNKEVLGTFAIYQDKPSKPDKKEIEIIEFASEVCSIAISKRRNFEKLDLYSQVFINAHEGMTITDSNGNIIDANESFSKITGYEFHEIKGKNPSILQSKRHEKEFYEKMWKSILTKGFWQGEISNRKKSGQIYDELLTISALKNSQDEIKNYIGLFSDITQIKKQQERLRILAHYDPLTKLPNRTLFKDRFDVAKAHAKRVDEMIAICFLDLDNFKLVNDKYGHDVGDMLLINFAKRIQEVLREEDTLSRQGGDEFTILLGSIDSLSTCKDIVERIMQSLKKPFFIDSYEINVTLSLGVTVFPNDNSDLDTLIRHADQAMYKAKITGKNRYYFFNITDDKELSSLHEKLTNIQNALENEQFTLFYQPKIDLQTSKLVGFEALIRWKKDEELIYPDDFLPYVSNAQLEIDIGKWVIKKAFEKLEEFRLNGLDLHISVNISPYHLMRSDFIFCIEKKLKEYSLINPNNFEIEILESSVFSDLSKCENIILNCKNSLGIRVALDDFGTGYSSLSHLRRLPADIIKIDKSFVINMIDSPSDRAIIEGVLLLSKAFSKEVIAEGVESDEHKNILLDLGCRYAQGFGIAKPMREELLFSWIDEYKKGQKKQ